MCKNFRTGLYSVLLLLLCVSGCYVAGAAGGPRMHYGPPKIIDCGKPWVISVNYSVVDPRKRRIDLTERFKDVAIHIHYASDNNIIDVPMVVESVNSKELQMKADMKPIPCDANIEYVGYYITYIFGNRYHKSPFYIVPVSKN